MFYNKITGEGWQRHIHVAEASRHQCWCTRVNTVLQAAEQVGQGHQPAGWRAAVQVQSKVLRATGQ